MKIGAVFTVCQYISLMQDWTRNLLQIDLISKAAGHKQGKSIKNPHSYCNLLKSLFKHFYQLKIR